jgi:hypothetical protein
MSLNCSHFYSPFVAKKISDNRRSSPARSRAPTSEKKNRTKGRSRGETSPPALEDRSGVDFWSNEKMAFGAGGCSVHRLVLFRKNCMGSREQAPLPPPRSLAQRSRRIKTKNIYTKQCGRRRAKNSSWLRFCLLIWAPPDHQIMISSAEKLQGEELILTSLGDR